MSSTVATAPTSPPIRPVPPAQEAPSPQAAAPRDTFSRMGRSGRTAIAPWIKPAGGAVALAAASALGASRSITPYLLSLKVPVDNSLLHIIPGVGPALSSLVGTSVFGCTASACLLATAVGTMTAGRDGTDVHTSWTLAHASIGFALSPLLLSGAAMATVPLALLLGCAVGLSGVLTARVVSGRCSWGGAIAGITLTLALAPVAAQLGLAGGGALASTHVLKTLASGSILATAYRLYGSWPRFISNNTAYVERFIANPVDVQRARLDLPGAEAPTVFGANQDIVDLVNWCKLAERHNEPCGMVKALLQGPAGSGKTEMARGIASALGASLAIVDAPRLTLPGGTGSSPANVLEIFSQARELRRSTGRPVVLFFDEVDSLAPNRDHMDATTAETRERNQLVNVLLQCLDGAHKPPDDSLVVLAATNYPERLDAAVRQRFLLGAQLQVPGRTELASMFHGHLRQVLRESPLRHRYAQTAVAADLAEQVVDHAVRAGWVGRDLAGFVARVATGLATAVHGAPQAILRDTVRAALRRAAPHASGAP